MTDSDAVCAQIVRESRSNFALSFRFLPRSQRLAMNALYAFCRRTDDIADSDAPLEKRRDELSAWREELTTHGRDPVLRAMARAVADFDLDPNHLHAVIDGCEMDLRQSRFQSLDDLKLYCSRVAGAVGRLCLGIWGVRGERADALADNLGFAVQITNILRDVGADARSGRVYIPCEILARHGVGEGDLTSARANESLRRALREMATLAKEAYARSNFEDFTREERRRLWPAEIIARIYGTLLTRIEERDFPVMDQRVRLSHWRKGAIAARVLSGRLIPW